MLLITNTHAPNNALLVPLDGLSRKAIGACYIACISSGTTKCEIKIKQSNPTMNQLGPLLSFFGLRNFLSKLTVLAFLLISGASYPQSRSAVDEAFLEARAATARYDAVRFAKVEALVSQHPLAVYGEYWKLRIGLHQASRTAQRTADASILEEKTKGFLKDHDGTVYADLLRRDYMLYLGRMQDWTNLEAVAKPWVLQDDRQAICFLQLAGFKREGSVAPAIVASLLQSNAFGEGCSALVESLLQAKVITPSDALVRIAGAVFANAPGSARAMMQAVPAWSDNITEAHWSKPELALKLASVRYDPDLSTAYLIRLLSLNFEAGLQLFRSDKQLSPRHRAIGLALAAAYSARRAEAQAHMIARELAELKLPAGRLTLSEDIGAWAMRAALRAQDWKSLLAIDRLLSPETRQDPAWVFWRARAVKEMASQNKGEIKPEAVAEAEKALQILAATPGGFYQQLAAEEIGQPITIPPGAAAATNDPQVLAVIQSPAVKRARQFYALDLRFEGNREWNWAIRGLSDAQLLAVSRWAVEEKLYDRAISTAERTRTQHDWGLRYLTPFGEPLTKAAKNHQLNPAIVFGLIRQESRFIPDVRSSAGASGLMQLMPATARWVAKKLEVKDYSAAQINDIATNLEFGSFYLRTVYDNLDENWALATAAYNAGPSRPRQWRSTLPGKLEGAAFAETIPFSETRDYVKKVLSNGVYYSLLLGAKAQSLKALLGEIQPKAPVAADIP